MTAHRTLLLLEIPTNRILLTPRLKQKSCGNHVFATLLFHRPLKQVVHLPPACFSHLCPPLPHRPPALSPRILWMNFGTLQAGALAPTPSVAGPHCANANLWPSAARARARARAGAPSSGGRGGLSCPHLQVRTSASWIYPPACKSCDWVCECKVLSIQSL